MKPSQNVARGMAFAPQGNRVFDELTVMENLEIGGYLLSHNRKAYHYLAESASRFYNSEEVKEMLVIAGFRQVSFRPFFLGVVGIHIAVK